MLEYIGTLVGLIYLWLEYKASVYLWIASVIMPAIYLFVYYEAGLYADVGINVYYLLAAVYGWINWQSKQNNGSTQSELPITQMPLRYYLPLGIICTTCFFAIVYLLKNYTDSTVPWLDSFTTALSIAGMWMLAKKYIEQWWVWLIVNLVCTGLYIYKGLEATAALYGLYAIITLLGYRKWKRLMFAEAAKENKNL
ncbi:MAG: nicotinamide riboside transporter PnuC [Phocaeicola sp.]